MPNTTQKTNERATRTPEKPEYGNKFSGKVSSFFSTCGTRRVILVTNPM